LVYLSSATISILLFLAEVSLLPHFLPWLTLPILVLPFISIISLKDRTIFPVILACLLGLLTDSVAGGQVHIYLVAYLGVVLISKLFLDRFLSYGEFRANMISLAFGITIIYGADLAFKIGSLSGWSWVLPLLANLLAILAVLTLYVWLGQRYFCWLEKETEERFR